MHKKTIPHDRALDYSGWQRQLLTYLKTMA
jgi:hypothetical protein